MPRNPQGLYTLPPGNPVVPGTLIEAEWANNTMDDLALALTESLPRDGSAAMTGQLSLVDQVTSPPSNPRFAISLGYLDAQLETIQTGASGGVGNPLIFENDRFATANYTITNGKNGMSAGPVSINPGVTIGIPAGSTWSIVGGGTSSGPDVALGDTLPIMDGSASAGIGTFASRNDHIHPSDTTRAPLISPQFSGVPLAPTAAPGTNSTQIATTAFVMANSSGGGSTPSDTNPAMNGAASPGVSTAYSRGDHVHPTDTSRAPLASPVFTGTPTVPTAAPGTNTTQAASTAFVAAAVTSAGGLLPSNNTPLMNGAASPGVGTAASRDDHVHPTDTSRAPLASPIFTGNPQAPTPTAGDSDTSIATTAFVSAAITGAATTFLSRANNLSDLTSVPQAQINLALSTAGEFNAACTDNNFAFTENANTFSQTQTFGAAVTEKAVAMAANAIQCNLGSVFSKTISGATTLTVSGAAAAGSVSSFILNLTNAGSLVTWWAGIKWPGGTVPTLTAAGRDVLGFFTIDGGITWSGLVMGKDLK